ncbi:MAG: hypothetical protein QG662_143 [Pseudomonadota bacterium]|nr:hypothetical protein [Pseudomonadota bacterium]
MNTIKTLTLATLAALSMGAAAVHAEDASTVESQSAAMETDKFFGAMQERYRVMQEQMRKIRQTQDHKERQKLMHEHWQTMHEGVGMMGSYGMGPGMMGGYGMGPGMMGGYGMGPGMMGGGYGKGPQGMPDLSAEQQTKISKIHEETRKKHWELMGMVMEEQARLRALYDAPKPDSAAINNTHKKISELQRRMYEASVEAHKNMESILAQEQKESPWRFWRR